MSACDELVVDLLRFTQQHFTICCQEQASDHIPARADEANSSHLPETMDPTASGLGWWERVKQLNTISGSAKLGIQVHKVAFLRSDK